MREHWTEGRRPFAEGVGKGAKAISHLGTEQLPGWDSHSWQSGIDFGQRRIPLGAGQELAWDSCPTVAGWNLSACSTPEGLPAPQESQDRKASWRNYRPRTGTSGHHVSCNRYWKRGVSRTPKSREQKAEHTELHAGLLAHSTRWRAGGTCGPTGPC